MDLKLKGKKALVMGASSGIGKAIAQILINEQADVAICSRSEENLIATQKQINASMIIKGDLSKEGEAKKVIEAFYKKMGSIDILVTNTGGPRKGNFCEISVEDWKKEFQNLYISVVESLNVSLPIMKKNKYGRIIMITSISAKEPLDKLTISNGLRSGLSGLTKSIANEYAQDNITINTIMPGYTDTERLRELGVNLESLKQTIPAKRLAEPKELGYLVAFLSSPQAGYITGQSILVDGGASKGF